MRILFYVRRQGAVYYYEPAIRRLAERGHRLHLAFDKYRGTPPAGTVTGDLLRSRPNLTASRAPKRKRAGAWAVWNNWLRAGVNYLFYSDTAFAGAPNLQGRREPSAPKLLRRIRDSRLLGRAPVLRVLRRILHALERATPVDAEVQQFVAQHSPDVVLVASLTRPDYVRAGKRVGATTGFCVRSWDNLTTKSFIHEPLDFVTVWNEGQRREAVELHGIPKERVRVTGSPTFDHWFAWSPSTTRQDFCARAGLDPSRPYLLYMGSSPQITGTAEPRFVARWLAGLRNSGRGPLRQVQVLVRPHPSKSSSKRWRDADLPSVGEGVSVWLTDRRPLDPGSRSDFFDSIYHSAAVVGVNTSAMIEAAIVGRSVYTLVDGEVAGAQGGTVHFGLITEFAGGLLNVAHSMDEHAAQLERALSGEDADEQAARRRRFLEAFVRPTGLERPAGEVLADAIEAAGSEPASGRRDLGVSRLLRVASTPFAWIAGWRLKTVDSHKART
jgi:hypothetical protein